jgi:hypothetical protein
MRGRLAAQGCPQVHRRDPSKNPVICGPCGQPSDLTPNTVASLSSPSSIPPYKEDAPASEGGPI